VSRLIACVLASAALAAAVLMLIGATSGLGAWALLVAQEC